MIAIEFSLVLGVLLLAQSPDGAGSIAGVVLNTSRGNAPEVSAEVMLRVRIDGEFVVVAQTTTDQEGRFRFDGLPLDQDVLLLPGANRDGVHYPGPRVQLSANRPSAGVVLRVQDTISEPNPLVLRDWDIVLDPQPGGLRITETLLIENPQTLTYVGQIPEGGAEPVTLQLGISSDFERVTFTKEFYGRQFAVIDGKPATGVPWTPGQHEVQFSYVLRNEGRQRVWTRPLDLPCRHVRLTVRTNDPNGLSCNLGPASSAEDGTVRFESNNRELPAGYLIRVELSRLPVSLMAQARWASLVLLVLLIAVSTLVLKRRSRASDRGQAGRGPHRPRRKARTRA